MLVTGDFDESSSLCAWRIVCCCANRYTSLYESMNREALVTKVSPVSSVCCRGHSRSRTHDVVVVGTTVKDVIKATISVARSPFHGVIIPSI